MRLWIHFYTIKKDKSLLRPVMIASLMMSSAQAIAGPLDTAYANAMVPYVVLKRGTVECGKPAGEHLAYKARLLNILGRIPNIDLFAADREIERAFEREAPRSGYSECSEALLELYKNMSGKSAEMALQHLSETVRDL
ncbi:hypothetical protein [Rhizobium sp. Leaf262]|uniref:hypothetical protein n=1 Tax=Rhizobium sp. Leaf262 TaxID=1736312 RepID=UPI000714878E|nr:hypothetical protein [Rhizobium sp. Leaf262]KQO80083.1 hypothetical protein ASF29_21360 [Rhizobium sp. Leaf262]